MATYIKGQRRVSYTIIENEAAYQAAIARRISANRIKGGQKRHANKMQNPEYAATIQQVINRGTFDDGSYKDNFFGKMVKALIGVQGELTDNQIAACRKIIAEDAARKAAMRLVDAGSQFVGTVKQRRDFTLTVTGYRYSEGMYGPGHFHAMKDADGNCFIYKGTVKLADKGNTVTFKATIKSHYESNGVKTTYLTRPA